MENTNTLETINPPESFLRALQLNTLIYPCDFNPLDFLEIAENKDDFGQSFYTFVLPAGVKRLWFYNYCKKNNLKGQIIPDVEVRFDMSNTTGAKMGYVLARCDIVIDGVTVGSAQAGQSVYLDNTRQMDGMVQFVTGAAQSKALTNAGFGAIPSTAPDLSGFTPGVVPAPTGSNEEPFTFGPDGVQNVTAPQASVALSGPLQVPQAGQGNADPKEAAKQLVWPYEGNNKGKTLGEILATSPRNLMWIVQKFKECPEKEAARLLFPDACVALGIACPAKY